MSSKATWKKIRERVAQLFAQRDMTFLVAARVSLLSIAMCALSLSSVLDPNYLKQVSFVYRPISVLYAFCAASALWLMYRSAGALFVWTQLVVDVFVVTGVVYLTGGDASPFLFLYVLLVMAAAILTSRRSAFGVAVLSAATYSVLCVGLNDRWFRSADGSAAAHRAANAVLLQVTGLSVAMVLVSILTSILIKKIRSSQETLVQAKEDLRALNQRQAALMEGFPEGIIGTTLDGKVSHLNRAAQQLLGCAEEKALGEDLRALLRPVVQDISALSLDVETSAEEVELMPDQTGRGRHVTIRRRRLSNDAGTQTGYLYIVQDVTKLRSIEEQLEAQERMARLLAAQDGESAGAPLRFSEFVGESAVMHKVFNLIQRVAASDATVLISGESGTGKELVAKAIHHGSPRANCAFVAVNCGAIPENLIESQLFGHKRGSFTGADADHSGMFRQAEGGTIFLDEIGELPLSMQAKLLRALQEKKVRPVGGDRDIPINVRIVAATNRNLKREITDGRFREDLFYRLNVINIILPPLRERREDIPLLVHATFRRLASAAKSPIVSPAAMQLLLNYDYPGNVRELENILERALVLGGEVVLPDHLPEHVKAPPPPANSSGMKETTIIVDENLEFPIDLDALLATVERKYLEGALVKSNGAKKKAADMLKMNFRSFRYRLQKFGLNAEEGE